MRKKGLHGKIRSMKVIAAITELNPLHKGHEYFFNAIRSLSGADLCITVMSGDYVQRGEPAIVNKYARAEMAVRGGCDLVLELPLRYSLGNAGTFASGAMGILDSLGVVDEVWFGSECGDIRRIRSAAEILADEPDDFKRILQERLKAGDPYPKARETALCSVCGEEYREVLSNPNNILGIEYCIAAHRLNSRIAMKTIKRTGSSYENPELSEEFSSALSIRKALLSSADPGILSGQLPDYSAKILQEQGGYLTADDFSDLLKYRLMEETAESLCTYQDVSPDLAKRIKNLENGFTGFSDFALKVKTRNYTYSHVARALFSILLKIRPQDLPSCVRILAMRDCGALLNAIRENGTCLLAAGASAMPESEYGNDLFASNLYESLRSLRFSVPFVHERSRKFLKL